MIEKDYMMQPFYVNVILYNGCVIPVCIPQCNKGDFKYIVTQVANSLSLQMRITGILYDKIFYLKTRSN